MKVTRKWRAIALGGAVVVALAIAIPTVIAARSAGGSNGLATSSVKPASVFTGTCAMSKMSYASNDASDQSGTLSTSYVDVPGMVVHFGTTTSCAEITFSSFAFQQGDNLMYVRALVNGTECMPGEVQFIGDDDENTNGEWARSHSYTFVCRGWHSGPHGSDAVVQFRAFSGTGNPVFAHKPTMVVRYG